MPRNQRIECDICIIGAGSGGLSVAAGTAQLGLHTVLIERGTMGGDCLNTGCVPSKALLAAGKRAQGIRKAQAFGINAGEPQIDFAGVKHHVQDVIDAIAPHDSAARFESLGVHVIQGEAAFIDKHNVQVGEKMIKARYFVIATGGRPVIPPINGLDRARALTNETIFTLQDKPAHLIIIGGGPIGVEMAQAHHDLGCRVTLLEQDRILPQDDRDLVGMLRGELQDRGIIIKEQVSIDKIEHEEHSDYAARLHVTDHNGQSEVLTASHILIAAGRRPNIESLQAEAAHITYTAQGITVNDRLQTSQKHIFAIGDVCGGPQFTHVAGYHAGIVIRNICFRLPAKVDYNALPWVTYTSPELAHVGMTPEQAIQKFGAAALDTHFFDLKDIDRAAAERLRKGGIKLLLHKRSARILGASILAPHAGEMIALWGLAIEKKATLRDVAGMIMPYPSYGDLSKRAAGGYFSPRLFSPRTRKIVRWLQKLPLF